MESAIGMEIIPDFGIEMIPVVEMVPDFGIEMIPVVEIVPVVEMVPANALDAIATVKSEAQRIAWKRFILSSPGKPSVSRDGQLEW